MSVEKPVWTISHQIGGRILAKRSDHPEFQVILNAHLMLGPKSEMSMPSEASDADLSKYLDWLAEKGKLWPTK